MTGTAATTTSASAARESARRRRRAVTRGGKHGKLNRGFLAGTFRASDFLLLIDHDFLEPLVAAIANVFVNRHVQGSPKWRQNWEGASPNYIAPASGHVPAAVYADGLTGDEFALRQHDRDLRDFVYIAKKAHR